jgi:hypothetical protein
MHSNDWFGNLIAADQAFAEPKADVADRVISKIQTISPSANRMDYPRDWVSPFFVGLATLMASLMYWYAIPSWNALSLPPVTLTEQMQVALDASK